MDISSRGCDWGREEEQISGAPGVNVRRYESTEDGEGERKDKKKENEKLKKKKWRAKRTIFARFLQAGNSGQTFTANVFLNLASVISSIF